MMTPKRRAVLRAYYNGTLREYEAIAQLKTTRDRFKHLRHLFAKEELNRLWTQ